MKQIKSVYFLMVILTTLLAMWILPSLVQKMTDSSKNYPFVYYSSILKELCVIDFYESQDNFYDIKGNEYPRASYDSLLPLLNFRQLMMNGTLPDTLEGQEVDPKVIRMKQLIFRFSPKKINAPQYPMGVLLEAMPKRLNLTLPGDYFRMSDEMTFIDAETNEVNVSKSSLFNKELVKKGFSFPVKHFWGNPTVRKPYEEGYFCLDNEGQLFHVKMVNGRPFVKNTGLGDQLDIKWFAMHEVPDKRYYGYLFGTNGEVGIVESTEEGNYYFRKMDIPPFDIEKEELSLMGNMLYWTVKIVSDKGADFYALHTNTLQQVSHYHMDPQQTLWNRFSEWLFLTTVSPEVEDSAYVSLYFTDISLKALLLNVVIVILFFIGRMNFVSKRRRGWAACYLLVTGLVGLLTLFILPPFEEK